MRIVKSLSEVKKCPNCLDHDNFSINFNEFDRMYLKCQFCNEELFEDEDTCSEESAIKEKENFIFEMREEISNLTWSIHDSKTQMLVENIQNIFNKIIDYIEEN